MALAMSTDSSFAARSLARVADPAGLLYGALIAASVLATASAHEGAFTFVAFATCAVLVIYWMSHVYIEAQSLQVAGDRRRFVRRVAQTARHESSVLKGGVPAIVVFMLVDLAGATPTRAATVAVYFSVAVLFCAGYLTAHQAGRRGLPGLVDAAAAGFFGVLVIFAKTLLH